MGYSTVTIKPAWNMFSVNFKNVGNNQGIAIDDLFPGGGKADTVFTYGTGEAKADYIKVWDAENQKYVDYFLFCPAKFPEKDAKSYYWCSAADGSLANKSFKNGDAFWFYSRNEEDVTATVSGEVELSAIKAVTIEPNWNMIGSYFPTGWKLNDEYYSPTYWQNSGAVYGTGEAKADYIKVWDAENQKYVDYFLFCPAKFPEKDAKSYQWCSAADGSVMSNAVNTTGQGMWYFHRGEGIELEIQKQF